MKIQNLLFASTGDETIVVMRELSLWLSWSSKRKKRAKNRRKSPLKMENVGYLGCLPGLPVFFAFQDLMADFDIQMVISPLFHKDSSYFAQFVTLYFVLYLGFLLRLCDSFTIDSINRWNISETNYLCTNAMFSWNMSLKMEILLNNEEKMDRKKHIKF